MHWYCIRPVRVTPLYMISYYIEPTHINTVILVSQNSKSTKEISITAITNIYSFNISHLSPSLPTILFPLSPSAVEISNLRVGEPPTAPTSSIRTEMKKVHFYFRGKEKGFSSVMDSLIIQFLYISTPSPRTVCQTL